MSKNSRAIPIIATIRTIFDVLSLVAVVLWGLLSFPLPLPAVAVAIAVGLTAVTVWALFLSARPVLHTDRYARALVALVFISCGAAAALNIGVNLWITAALFITAATVSYFDVLAATKH